MDRGAHSFSVKNENGFTLVEIMVSLIILLILVVAFVPMFTFVAQAVSNNTAKDTATALANEQIEYLRTLPFVVKDADGGIKTDPNVPQLGFVGGNPPGSIPAADATLTKKVNGKNYIVKTDISWDESGKFKKVSISVEYPSAFGSGTKVINRFYTLAAEEGELDLPAAGNIRVQIYDKSGYPFTSTDLLVKIMSNDGSEQQNYTENGEKLFGILDAGYYTVYAQVPEELSFRPNQITDEHGWLMLTNIQVTDNNTVNAPFYIDLPGKINLKMEDDGNAITGNGILHISWSDGTSTKDFSPMNFSASDFSNEELLASKIKNQLGNLWPGGSYTIKLTDVLDNTSLRAYDIYDMSVDGTPNPKLINGSDWNGSFDTAGSTIHISVELDSLLKTHLDAATGVTIEPHTYTDPSTGETMIVDRVMSWEDQSGSNNNAFPLSSEIIDGRVQNPLGMLVEKPDLIPDIIYGNPVIRFNESFPQGLEMDQGVECTDNFTIFVVAKAGTTHEIDPLLEQYGGVAGQKYLFGANHKGSLAGAGLSFGTNGVANYEHGDNYMPPTAVFNGQLTEFQVITIKYEDTESIKPIANIYLNGNLEAAGKQSGRDTVFSPTLIGCGSYGYFSGDVAEILIYDCTLNDDNIEFISDYLSNKYRL